MTDHLEPTVRVLAGPDRASARALSPADLRLESLSAATTELEASLAPASDAPCVIAELSVRADRAWRLDGRRRLVPIGAEVAATLPVGAGAIVEHGGQVHQIGLDGGMAPALTFEVAGGRLTARAIVRDWGSTGLSYWKGPLDAPPATQVRARLHRLPSVGHALWAEPYPRGARAAVCLTDHADHDTVEKLRPLVDLLGHHEVRYTKSVFPQSEPRPSQGKFEPGLDDPAFRALVREANERGAEIAYHSFGPRPRVPTLEEARSAAELMATFGTTTYIDHGKGDHNYAHDDVLAPGVALSEFLAAYGVENYWSHFDAYQNPFELRSTWAAIPRAAFATDAVRSLRSLGRLDHRAVTYLALHGLNNVVGAEATTRVRQRRLRSPNELLAERRTLRARQQAPVLIYRPSGDTVFDRSASPDGAHRLWIFDTVLLNHLGGQLAPAAVNELIDESGLLLGHCYLGAAAPYMRSHTLEGRGGTWRAHPAFRTAIEHLGERQRTGGVATVGFADLRASLERFRDTELVRHDHGWEVRGGDHGCAAVSHDAQLAFRATEGAASARANHPMTTWVPGAGRLSLADPSAAG